MAKILISEEDLSASSSRALSEVGGQTSKPPPARCTVDEVIDAVAAGLDADGTQAEGIVPGQVLPEAVQLLSRRKRQISAHVLAIRMEADGLVLTPDAIVPLAGWITSDGIRCIFITYCQMAHPHLWG